MFKRINMIKKRNVQKSKQNYKGNKKNKKEQGKKGGMMDVASGDFRG